MPMPVKSLPTVQNWNCHSCSDCCRTYSVGVSEAERTRIHQQGWAKEPGFERIEQIVRDRSGGWRLNHTADGACVFLDEKNRCRIHAKFGEPAKPMACRIYPFVLVPAGDHWRVGIRFACPSALQNKGEALGAHADDLKEYAELLEADAATPIASDTAPALQAGQSISWPDLLRFQKTILKLVADETHPVERRLRQVIAVAQTCKQSRFDSITGARLKEFLKVIGVAMAEEVPADPYSVPKPGWVGRMLFRQQLALYARKDNGPNAGIASQSRWIRIQAAWRFARGQGRVPKLHAQIPDTTFQEMEAPAGESTVAEEQLLSRYYQVKIESMQFCGPNNFQRHFWDGLDSLLLTYPVIRWLSRAFAQKDRDPQEAAAMAVQIVDDNFGFNKLLGAPRQTWATKTMADRDEISKLIAWYSR